MATPKTNFIIEDGKLTPVYPVGTVQIASESDLTTYADELDKLPPESWAHTPGWKAAWQKKADGTWIKA